MHRLSKRRDGKAYVMIGPHCGEDTEAMLVKFRALVPVDHRSWSKTSRAWHIDLRYGLEVQRMIDAHYGIAASRAAVERLLERLSWLEYLVGLWTDRWRPLARARKRRIQADHGIERCEGCSAVINCNSEQTWGASDDGCYLCEACINVAEE